MTKREQVKTHLRMIHQATAPGTIRYLHTIVATIEEDLDAIKDLLQVHEPESLASSVLRLTDECNRLEAELTTVVKSNALLRNLLQRKKELLRERWDKIKVLETELDAVTRSNAFLRERLSFAECSLKGCRDAEEVLKKQVARHERFTVARGEHHKTLLQDIDTVTRNNAELMEEIVKQNKYIELLKKDRRTAFEQGYSVCRRGSK